MLLGYQTGMKQVPTSALGVNMQHDDDNRTIYVYKCPLLKLGH